MVVMIDVFYREDCAGVCDDGVRTVRCHSCAQRSACAVEGDWKEEKQKGKPGDGLPRLKGGAEERRTAYIT